MENQAKIKFGGIKLLSGGSCLVNSSPGGEFRLSSQVTSPLAENRLNLTFLTHVAGDRTSLCTTDAVGEGPLALLRQVAGSDDAFQYEKDIALLAVYPHDKLAKNIGAFIHTLAGSKSKIFGLASSLSAITTIVENRRQEKVVKCLFENFEFTSFATAQDFFSAQEFPEEYVRKAVATYQEKVIKVYWVLPYPDLDLWAASIPSAAILRDIADILIKLGELGLTLPFLIAIPRLQTDELLIAFSTARPQGAKDQGSDIRRLLSEHIPGIRPMRLTPVAGIFLHGPHFGDRYGIANTLVEALERVHVSILALSCTISSISVIIRQQELAQALLVLSEKFDGPVSEPLYGV
jgi:aspartokinase